MHQRDAESLKMNIKGQNLNRQAVRKRHNDEKQLKGDIKQPKMTEKRHKMSKRRQP